MKKPNSVVIPFIREEGMKGITTIALMSFKLNKKMTKNQIIKALTSLITRWIKNTEHGHKAWKETCGDFNVGDLAMYYDTFLQDTPHALLTRLGIHDMQMIDCGDDVGYESFDKILVDTNNLPNDWHMEA